jgi:hypothetical protein
MEDLGNSFQNEHCCPKCLGEIEKLSKIRLWALKDKGSFGGFCGLYLIDYNLLSYETYLLFVKTVKSMQNDFLPTPPLPLRAVYDLPSSPKYLPVPVHGNNGPQKLGL